MLLGWLGATLVIIVELVLLLFWIALVPSRGRELVLCCLADTAPEALEGIVVRAGFSGLSSSSERRASTCVSGTLLLRPYLELMEERTELEMEPELSSLSLSWVDSLVDSSEVGVVLNSEFRAMSFSDFEMCRELREFGREDLRERFDDWEGDLEGMREAREPWWEPAICSTLEKISQLLSEPILLRLASIDRRVRESEARADSKLPFQLYRSSS
jgi:hypothetical protein